MADDLAQVTWANLLAAQEAIEQETFRPVQYVLHPREHAWIDNPVGAAPSVTAVNAALALGRITADHPEVQRIVHFFTNPA